MTATVVLVLRIGLAILLYLFIWQVLRTLRQDLKQQGTLLSRPPKPGIHLDAKLADGREDNFHFWKSEIILGRASHCDISFKDEALSANHARVSRHHAQWWLEDTGSTNGTFLNDNLITVPTVIISGDVIKCGNTTFLVRIDETEDSLPPNQKN